MTQRCLALGCLSTMVFLAGVAAASEQRETPTVKAVKRAAPSVVNIHTEKPAQEGQTVFSSGKGRRINGMGTGVVVDERGYIVTNYHVVAEVEVIRATFEDGSDYDARTVSFDKEHDLALIKVDAGKPFKVAPLGTSSDLMLGESVIAIGNAFGYKSTVTLGIISALGRDVEVNETQSYKNLIQTDASINPGNSGGPLINLDGDVIGVNVAIRAGAQRIGFAIPIDDARRIVARLISVENLDQQTHGLITRDVKSSNVRQLVVMGTHPNSPAVSAGLKPGDVVLKVGEHEIGDGVDLERALLGRKSGEAVEMLVRRSDKTEKVAISLAPQLTGKSSIGMQVVPQATGVDETEADRIWSQLGMRVSTLPAAQISLVGPRYRGGMKVVDVRADSPAARNGIRKGDILVGLSKWETVSAENVTWILNQAPTAATEGLKFYLIRGSETLYGHLQVAGKQ